MNARTQAVGEPLTGGGLDVPGGLRTLGGSCKADPAWANPLSAALRSSVHALANDARRKAGLPTLGTHGALESAAMWKAMHMAGFSYMAHDDPAPPYLRSTTERIAACGFTAGWGENIAMGYPDPASVHVGWMGSLGHRGNILRPTFRALGVGAARKGDGPIYWAQCFGTSDGGAGPPPEPTPQVIEVRARMLLLHREFQQSNPFKKWARDNPEELRALEQLWDTGVLPQPPETHMGKAYEQAARAYRESL